MMWLSPLIVLLIGMLVGVTFIVYSRGSKKAASLPPAFLIRFIASLQPLVRPVSDAKGIAPSDFSPIDVVTVEAPYPGALLFTNATNPFRDDCENHFGRYIAEIDKYTGQLLRYRRILTKAYLFQPQPEGYSYAVLEKAGVKGGGHDGTHYLTNENLRIIRRYKVYNPPNSSTDMHEFLRLENGNVLLLSYRTRVVNLSGRNGGENSLVYDPVVVEQTESGETVWIWDGEDHLDVQASTKGPDVDLDARPPLHVDYAHPNALSLFPDGNLLLSLKHMDCLLKIDRSSGAVIWVMGGANSNGQFTPAQGSVERLPNGNTLIGWGFATTPFVSEVTPEGKAVLEMNLPNGQIVYRVYQGK